ncbi:DUF3658 domain-containing protein [Asticcacaulis sp. 201]|uniref:DUF3658 domain-containing protein n=1 Tax=Asticcacaulis sp. 201 TaxID=3028787 RepID=UPI002916C56D|nr:DUF3658 domain-containing protein [Asticcacaulis sp. 201]MDV6329947.1 DUF3658 domain-containing protein [Asticcacaulis sp. 201]
MTSTPLHVVFSSSAAVSLRDGLAMVGREDEVIGLQDNLSQGPIDGDDLNARLDAIEDLLEIDIDEEDRAEIERFWRISLDNTRPRIVWLSRWSSAEYCGFLEWRRRNGDAPFQLVDVTDTALPDLSTPGIFYAVQCVSLVTDKRFAENALWDRAVTPDQRTLSKWLDLWDRLRRENAPLRVLTPDGLVSAQMDYFDADLLKHATTNWDFDRTLVGKVMGDMMFDTFRDGGGVFQCGDLVLFARVRALVQQGVLEGLGDPYEREFKVRLRA